MKIVGLTGSIAMGKTTASKMLKNMRLEVFDADKAVHKILKNNKKAKKEIIKTFGEDIFVNGKISHEKLGKIVFNNEKNIKKLENIIHPIVKEKMFLFIKKHQKNKKNIVILDIPLLFEVSWDKYCDYTFVVKSDYKTQKERVLKRKNMTEEKFENILKKQMPIEEKCKKADFIIPSDKGFETTKKALRKAIKEIKK